MSNNNIMDTVDIQLPLGLIGLELEPNRTEGRIKIGCRVRRWNVPSKDMDLLGPGTEIYAIDSIYVADRTFKEVIKILKKSSKRLLTIAKKTTLSADKRSPAFLIRAMLQSEMINNFKDSPKKENMSLMNFSPTSSFSSPSSTKSLNIKHTSTTKKITRTETEIVDNMILFESNISGEENNAIAHSAKKIVRTTVTNEEEVYDTLTMQTSTSTSDCSPTFISDISSCNSNQSNIITISSTFLNTSQLTTSDTSCLSEDSSSKVMLVLNGQQTTYSNRTNDNMQIARTDENMFNLQSALVDRENKIQSLLMEINSLKRNARGSAGQIMFLEFQVEKLQAQKRKEEETALTISQSASHTMEILRSPVSDKDRGRSFTPDREAWLLHWRKSRAVLASLQLPKSASGNEQTRQSLEITNETETTSLPIAATSRALTQHQISERVNNDTINVSEKGFKAPLFTASESDEIKTLSRQLTEQSIMNGKLKGKLRSWVSMQLQALRLLTEDGEEGHGTESYGINEELEGVGEREAVGPDTVSSPPSYSSSSSASPTTPSVRIIKNPKRLMLPKGPLPQTLDKIPSFSSPPPLDTMSPAEGSNNNNNNNNNTGSVSSSYHSVSNSDVVSLTPEDVEAREPSSTTIPPTSVGASFMSIDLPVARPSSGLDTSAPPGDKDLALLTSGLWNKNEFISSSSSSTSSISSCTFDSQYDLAPPLPPTTTSAVRVTGTSSQSTRRPLYELLQRQEGRGSNPTTFRPTSTSTSVSSQRPPWESLPGAAGGTASSKDSLPQKYAGLYQHQGESHSRTAARFASLYSDSNNLSGARRGMADHEPRDRVTGTQTAFSGTDKLRNQCDWGDDRDCSMKFQRPRSNSSSSSGCTSGSGITDSSVSLLLAQHDKENRGSENGKAKSKALTEMEKLRESNQTVKDDIRRFRGTLQKIREDCSGSDHCSSKEGGSGGGGGGGSGSGSGGGRIALLK